MGDKLLSELGTIVTGIIGVAIIAVIVSKNSQTSGVISNAGTAFSNVIKAAVAPATSNTIGL